MAFLLGFLDCLPFRRMLFCNDAARDQDEQDAVHQQRRSSGYYPEPAPAVGSPRQSPGSPSRSIRFSRISTGFHNRRHPTWYGAGGRSPNTRAKSTAQRAFQRRMARSNDANNSSRSLSSTPTNTTHYEYYGGRSYTPPRRENSGWGWVRPHAGAPATLSLNARDMDVINALFYRPGAPRVAEVEWTDFLRAMRRIGFSGSPNGGSYYRFHVASGSEIFPVGSRGEVITAHRPHGRRTTLSLIEMRAIGQRMSNAFGWSADTFTSD